MCWIEDRSWTTDANGNNSWTYPAAFVDLPACWGTSYSAGAGIREFRSGSTPASMRVKVINPAGNNLASTPMQAALFAVGRWR